MDLKTKKTGKSLPRFSNDCVKKTKTKTIVNSVTALWTKSQRPAFNKTKMRRGDVLKVVLFFTGA